MENFLKKYDQPNGCNLALCACEGNNPAAVEEWRNGRWFITMGHPGFNSPANNGKGYQTEARARQAIKKFGGKK